MNIVYKNISALKPYENNPRINDNAIEYVANSIQEFGFKVPIVVDKDEVIVAGHTRYKACKRLGIENIPCIVADDLTEEQIKAFRLADNKVSESSQWDFNLLDIELNSIHDIDLENFGFITNDDFNLDDLFVDKEIQKESEKKLTTCPHCGKSIEV